MEWDCCCVSRLQAMACIAGLSTGIERKRFMADTASSAVSTKGELKMKVKSPKRLFALWSGILAAGTWILPPGAFMTAPALAVAAPFRSETLQPTGPGAWVWREGANIAKAMQDLSTAVSGQAAPAGAMLSLIEVEGEQRLGLVSSDSDGDTAHWTSQLGRTATEPMTAQASSQLIEGEGGAVGVATQSVTIQPILIELTSLPSSPSLLGVQVSIDLSVHQAGAIASEAQFNSIIPLEFGYDFESELEPLHALAAAIGGTATDDNNPSIHPVGGAGLISIDCTQHPDGAGWNGCYCQCWREWKASRENFDEGLWIAIKACGLLVAATVLGCGAVCLLSIPTGGGASAACVWCLKVLGGEAVACVTGVLASYAASAAHFRDKRRACVGRCGNSNPYWDWSEIEPAKISEE